MAAVEVPAPVAPVVVNGLRFKAKPEAEVLPERRDSRQATEEHTSAIQQIQNRSSIHIQKRSAVGAAIGPFNKTQIPHLTRRE